MTRPVLRGHPWGPENLTGGPIDDIFGQLRRLHRDLVVERMAANRPSDDDNVFWIGTASEFEIVQVDTWPGGRPPFYLEDDRGQMQTSDVAEAVAMIHGALLGAAGTAELAAGPAL